MWVKLADFLSISSTLVVAFAALLTHRKLNNKRGRAAKVYFYFRAVSEVLLLITALRNIPNFLLVYFYCIGEIACITFIISNAFTMKSYKVMLWTFSGLIMAGVLIEAIFHFPSEMNSLTRFSEGIFLFCICAITVFRMYKSPQRKLVKQLPEFWIARGVMFYFAVHIWVALTANYAFQSFENDKTVYLWVFNSVANTITNIIYLCWLQLVYRST